MRLQLASSWLLPTLGLFGLASATVQGSNTASDRQSWADGFDISTNYYDHVPDTGVTREYWFTVENTTASPDGVEMPVQLINGSFPGPTIVADWGDTVVVHLTSALSNNGTGIHFHGIRQNWTNAADGVPSLTQCPIAPGQTHTYTWRAVEYGTGWYHSHFYVQAWDGVFGGIVINGPATANYDVDLGPVFLTDWYHQTADQLVDAAATGGPPTAPNGLINGTNTWTTSANETVGARFSTNFTAGTRYRMRLINAAADNHFRFMIDNHTMEVVAADFVPIEPFNATQLSIGMGQRYDVIVEAKDLDSGNFWMRSLPQTSCSESDATDSIRGIVRYDASSTAEPTDSESVAWDYTDSCEDEDASNLVPYVALNASSTYAYNSTTDVGVEVTDNALLWAMNGTSFRTEWDYPTLLMVAEDNTTWTAEEVVLELPEADKWAYVVVYSPFAQDHPMHLHGHDFWLLGSGYGRLDTSDTSGLNFVNPPRRDVAMMPASGYLVIGFPSNNPGVSCVSVHLS